MRLSLGARLESELSLTRVIRQLSNENYFEWVTVIEAALEARERFTMIELGAGRAGGLSMGAFAVRQTSGVPLMLVGVESEPRHCAWMKQHFADNAIKRRERNLLRAAAAAAGGHVWFRVVTQLRQIRTATT